MKKLYFHVVLLLLTHSIIFGQSTDPILGKYGTQWHHCLHPDGFEPQLAVAVFNTVTDTTFTDDLYYSLVEGEFVVSPYTYYEGTSINQLWLASNSEQVYYVIDDSLHLLFDFEAEVGDTLTLRFPVEIDPTWFAEHPDSPIHYQLIIHEHSLIDFEGQQLRRHHFYKVEDEGEMVMAPAYVGYYFTEKLGFQNFLLPYIHEEGHSDFNIACDLNYYQDDEITFGIANGNCTVLNTSDSKLRNLVVTPNPSSNYLFLEVNELPSETLLYDINGRLIESFEKVTEFYLGHLSRGIYWMKVRWLDEIQVVKIIKQ